MDQFSSKRRKLSPSTSVAANPLNTDARPTSQDGARSSNHRASFMSPTKASLARFNPDLLPSAKSSGPRRPPGRKSTSVRTDASTINSQDDGSKGDTRTRPGNEPPGMDTGNGEPEAEDGSNSPSNGPSAAPRRRSRTPNVQHTPSKLPQTQPAHRMRALPSRITETTPHLDRNMQGNGREVASQGERPRSGVMIDESSMEKLPHTPTRHGIPSGAGQAQGSEPSLPPTPSQLGLEAQPERPKGLLFGTPSKRTKNKEKGSLPLKPKEAPPEQPRVERPTTATLGPKVFLASLPRPPPTLEQVQLLEKITQRTQMEREVLNLGSSVLEGALLSSWQNSAAKGTAGQQKQRKRLTEMSSKLLRLREDIEQLQALVDGTDDMPLEDQGVHRADAYLSDVSTSKPMGLPQKLSLFFPFSNDGNNAARSRIGSDIMTVDPGQTVRIMNSSFQDAYTNDSEKLLQSHEAEFLSKGSVFVKLKITFNSKMLEIFQMILCEPGLFASEELETWTLVNAKAKQLTSIGTALSRCFDVVGRRAACWRSCEERFSDVIEPSHGEIRDPKTMKFRRLDLSLTIKWTIKLKNEGEAESRLSIHTEFPHAWQDDGIISGSEGEQVREAFDLLVRERGVTEAIAATVKLLFQSD